MFCAISHTGDYAIYYGIENRNAQGGLLGGKLCALFQADDRAGIVVIGAFLATTAGQALEVLPLFILVDSNGKRWMAILLTLSLQVNIIFM